MMGRACTGTVPGRGRGPPEGVEHRRGDRAHDRRSALSSRRARGRGIGLCMSTIVSPEPGPRAPLAQRGDRDAPSLLTQSVPRRGGTDPGVRDRAAWIRILVRTIFRQLASALLWVCPCRHVDGSRGDTSARPHVQMFTPERSGRTKGRGQAEFARDRVPGEEVSREKRRSKGVPPGDVKPTVRLAGLVDLHSSFASSRRSRHGGGVDLSGVHWALVPGSRYGTPVDTENADTGELPRTVCESTRASERVLPARRRSVLRRCR
jgi:hypothetical protein